MLREARAIPPLPHKPRRRVAAGSICPATSKGGASRLSRARTSSQPHFALLAGLRDFGYVEGQNLTIEYRFALGQTRSYDELAQDLIRLDPAAIVLTGTPAALALKRQTTTIPIIVAPIADPVALGLARGLSRPESNVTGVTMYGPELAHKRMEILKEALIRARRIVVLGNAQNQLHKFLWDDMQPSGRALGLEFNLFTVADIDELPTVLAAIAREGFDAFTPPL
jgi:putative ABC transport system substrate-binding protein